MNVHGSPPHAVLVARVDPDGRLVEADAALLGLNARAGGGIGMPLAPPALATVARLARRLGIIVSRSVTVADEEADVELWVRAQPEPDGGVRLSASGWRETPTWAPHADPITDVRTGGDWRWETDATLRLTLVSPDGGQRMGFDPFASLGKPLTALFDLESEGDGLLPILSALAGRQALVDQPARLRATGAGLLLSAVVRPGSDGGFGGFVGSARTKEAAEVPVAEAGLSRSFTAGLDRALRAPLARIVANANSINAQADGPIAADYGDYAADIASAGRHLMALIDDLVDLQAIERDDFAPTVEAIDLADIVRRAAGLLAVRAAHAQVTIDRPTPDASVPARGDFRRVLQILVNLVGNAVRYTPTGGHVTVEALLLEDTARAIVTDHGKGIAAEDQARIFGKFERVDPSEPGGNGLGLYIARRLARAMGGDLTVESTPGEGARFTLTLAAR